MHEVAAFSSLAVTLGLVLSRPRVGKRYRVGPAIAAAAGVCVMVVSGLVGVHDLAEAGRVLWRPLAAIASIMVLAAAALRLGILERLAAETYPRSRGSTTRLFTLVFWLSAATSAVLNNDAAVLLLTPLVVLLVRSVYPERARLVVPFAFAVFMAAGVAPMVVSNPMNMIVAEFAGIGFNEYALRMLPISAAGWVVAFLVLRRIFRSDLEAAQPTGAVPTVRRWGAGQWQGLAVLLAVLAAYPVVSYAGGPIWIVAASGALLVLLVCWWHGGGKPAEVLRTDVSWETMLFFLGALLLAFGLQNAGFVDRLTSLYTGGSVATIGAASAVGSAAINNHPMALVNMLAIRDASGAGDQAYLAALIGGDLGPRLLPIGSLAGLLWFASLRRMGVEVAVTRFVMVGAAVTVPSLAVSLALLAWL